MTEIVGGINDDGFPAISEFEEKEFTARENNDVAIPWRQLAEKKVYEIIETRNINIQGRRAIILALKANNGETVKMWATSVIIRDNQTCRKCVKRSLISSMKGENILLLSPLLKKYLEMGLVVTNVEFVIEYNGKRVFEWFMNEVVNDRRMADLNPEYAVRGETSKTKGNSGYGRTLMNKFTHTKLTFTKEKNTSIHVSSPYFKTMQELNGGVYEIEKQKRKVLLDLPMQIGLAVYSYAKLQLIGFWEFLNTYLMNDHYQLMECDTDSLYIAFAKSNIDDCVKPELRERWLLEKWHWFSSEDTETMIPFQGGVISLKQFDKRTPGKFKPEFVGDGQLCLNSKVFHIWNDEKEKTSCKGVQKRRNRLHRDDFLAVIETQKPKTYTNAGFIKETDKTTGEPGIKTYTQTKQGLSYFYTKRIVLSDGVSTTHLNI